MTAGARELVFALTCLWLQSASAETGRPQRSDVSYDFFNSLTPTTGHHAGLYRSEHAAATDRNADAAVHQYVRAGVPADKIVLGVAFYGRGFAGVTALNF